MTGGRTSSSTNSGANSTAGSPGTSARTTPTSTSGIAEGICSRAATTATAATTASRAIRISRVGSIENLGPNASRNQGMVTPLYRQIAGFSIGTLQLDVSSALCLLRWLFTIEEAGERRDAGC